MIVQTTNRSIEEIDGIRHGDTRYKDQNPLIIDPAMLREGRRTLVALHASSVCSSEHLGHVLLFIWSYVYMIFRKLVKDLVVLGMMLGHWGEYFPTFQEHNTFIFRVKQSVKNSHVARKGSYIGMGRARTLAGEPKGR